MFGPPLRVQSAALGQPQAAVGPAVIATHRGRGSRNRGRGVRVAVDQHGGQARGIGAAQAGGRPDDGQCVMRRHAQFDQRLPDQGIPARRHTDIVGSHHGLHQTGPHQLAHQRLRPAPAAVGDDRDRHLRDEGIGHQIVEPGARAEPRVEHHPLQQGLLGLAHLLDQDPHQHIAVGADTSFTQLGRDPQPFVGQRQELPVALDAPLHGKAEGGEGGVEHRAVAIETQVGQGIEIEHQRAQRVGTAEQVGGGGSGTIQWRRHRTRVAQLTFVARPPEGGLGGPSWVCRPPGDPMVVGMAPSSPMRLVLVDDHEMVIEGLKAMLVSFEDRVQVVGQAVGAERALVVVAELDPDIVLCDVRMQGSSGLDLCLALRERDPDRKIVMLSVYEDEQYLFQALRVGASGYLLKSISSDELVRQLELAHRGQTAIDPGMAARAADTAARLQRDEFWPGARQGLTQRESEILSYVVSGLSNRGIAAKLVIGEETVKTHLSSIYRKLGVGDRTGAVATALREGIYR